MWAFAKFNVRPSAELLNATNLVATNSITYFNPQDIANLMWAFAKLNLKPSAELIKAASLVATNSITSFTPQGLTNLFWAFAKLNLKPSAELLTATTLVATNSITYFNPQAIANMLWSFAKFDARPSADFINAASLVATNSITYFNPQDIANMLWSFAKFDLKPSADLVNAASLVAIDSIDSFSPQSIANMLWAFAKFNLEPSADLVNAASLVAINSIDSFSPQNIANLMWAFAIIDNSFNLLTRDEKEAVLKLFEVAKKITIFSIKAKHQIYLAFQYFKYVQILDERLQPFPQEWLTDFASEKQTVSKTEEIELDKMDHIVNITISRQRFITEVGTYVDGYFEQGGKRHIVQIDGPHHFTEIKGRLTQDPGDRLMDAILKKFGFIVERKAVGI
jgi:hypothetical protein